MSEPIGSWIGAAVTGAVAIAAGSWALIRRLLSTVTREELAVIIRELKTESNSNLLEAESRYEKKMDEMRQTILSLHEDNKEARHRLRDSLSAPFNKLNTEIIRLRDILSKLDRSGGR